MKKNNTDFGTALIIQLLFIALAIFVMPIITRALWNVAIAPVCHFDTISYWQMVAIHLFVNLIAPISKN